MARPDVKVLLERSLRAKNSTAAGVVIEQLLANINEAAAELMPLCQDCGYVTLFAVVGQDILFDGDFSAAVQQGVKQAYERGYLRQSVIRDAYLAREAPETENPAQIHVSLAPGNALQMTVIAKGAGSDNAGRMVMLNPTAGVEEIIEFVVETVALSGPKACPPLFVGVGIGGSFDSVGLLAKEALLDDFIEDKSPPEIQDLEGWLMDKINGLGMGPGGLGGETTVLGVRVRTAPAHLACLPVAVNLSCNQLRTAKGRL